MQKRAIDEDAHDQGEMETALSRARWHDLSDDRAVETGYHHGNRSFAIAAYLSRLRRLRTLFSQSLRQGDDLLHLLSSLAPDLCDTLGATGLVISYGSAKNAVGRTPPQGAISAILKDITRGRGHRTSFSCQAQPGHPDGAEPGEPAFDVVVHSLASEVPCQLLWCFADTRGAQRETHGRRGVPELARRGSIRSQHWRDEEVAAVCNLLDEDLKADARYRRLTRENARLRDFAAMSAHDIKAPLRGISYALATMREENFAETCVRESHAIAETSVKRLTELTDGLLELAMIDGNRDTFALVDVSKLVSDVVDMLSLQIRESDARIEIGALPTLAGSRDQLLRLFLNLVGNAIKFAAKGRPPVIVLQSSRFSEDRVEISIADNGIGIAPELSERAFQPLHRLNMNDGTEGAGLGLSIAERIVIHHRGTIRLDSDYREGARFVMTFPALD